MVDQPLLRAHHVADGDGGKSVPQGSPRSFACGLRGPVDAHAAAQHVGADDEEAVGVDRPAGPDHMLPPAGLAGDGMRLGHVLVAGQRMADQHRVAARRRSACRRCDRPRPAAAGARRSPAPCRRRRRQVLSAARLSVALFDPSTAADMQTRNLLSQRSGFAALPASGYLFRPVYLRFRVSLPPMRQCRAQPLRDDPPDARLDGPRRGTRRTLDLTSAARRTRPLDDCASTIC